MEHMLGTLDLGKQADLTMLESDSFKTAMDEIGVTYLAE
jgi:predicted amidohydrolase YtcJ